MCWNKNNDDQWGVKDIKFESVLVNGGYSGTKRLHNDL
jgi:hypothetical protein